MTDPLDNRGSPRPDTFFDTPSASDEEGSMSESIPSSPPLPPPVPPRRQRSPTRKKGFYLGPVGSRNITNYDERENSLRNYPGFLALTSSPGMETLSHAADSQHQREEESEAVLTGSVAELAMARNLQSVDFQPAGSIRTAFRSSPRISHMLEDRKCKADAALENHILDVHTITLQALRGETIGANVRGSSGEHVRIDAVDHSRKRSASAPAPRKVHVVPPPIDTSYVHKPIPDDIIRTPYPFQHRKSRWSQSTPLTPGSFKSQLRESILTLSIRRHGTLLSLHSSKVTIPAHSIMTDVKATSASRRERHFSSLDFDDEAFFRRLRTEYAKMAGWWRFFSARTLQRIEVGHSSACTRCVQQRARNLGSVGKDESQRNAWSASWPQGAGPAYGPRSPYLLVSQGLNDTFSEAKLLHNYQSPRLTGKGRYAWVQWAQRLVANEGMLVTPLTTESPQFGAQYNPTAHCPKSEGKRFQEKSHPNSAQEGTIDPAWHLPDSTGTFPCAAGLEFVEGWSYIRIIFALTTVLVLALAAMLLWIFLGLGGLPHTGFRDAAGRTGTGVLLGGFMLLAGWTSVLGWLAVSWLVI